MAPCPHCGEDYDRIRTDQESGCDVYVHTADRVVCFQRPGHQPMIRMKL